MRRLRTATSIGAVVMAGAILLAACSSSTSPSSSPSTGTKVSGGTATWAEVPATVPNYIFPFMTLAFFSVANTEQFQYLMYRPLFWFGVGNTPDLNTSLSIAKTPVYSNGNKTVTISLNNYKWSNGEAVTAGDVMFWMNLMHAQKKNWAAYAPGTIPDNIASIKIDSNSQITFNLTQAYNTQWFTYNQLSQITPLPAAWNITSAGASAGSGGCSMTTYGTTDTACTAVYTFLSKEAGFDPANPSAANNSLSTYATNPIWQVVDGPWRLSAFDSSGDVTMVPNKSYTGPVKPTLSAFKEVPFTSDTAQFNALVAGDLDFGYLPFQDVTASASSPTSPGANNPRLTNYSLDPLYTWSINYFPYNFNSSGKVGSTTAGALFKQLYLRQAMQILVDQPLYLPKIFKGYAVPTYGPVPVLPANTYSSSFETSNPYPYSVSKAKSLLTDHGWKVVAGGTSTCVKPGTASDECGAGIPSGTPLAFDLQYATGTTWITQLMNTEKSSWDQVGINVALSSATFDTVIGNATPCTPGPSCTWQLENWGGGWVFSPDYYPSGEEIFATGAGSNSGSYSDPTNDSNIKATYTTNVPLTNYENYLAKNLPVIWQPDPSSSLSEIAKNLHGATPQNVLWALTPENWYFTK